MVKHEWLVLACRLNCLQSERKIFNTPEEQMHFLKTSIFILTQILLNLALLSPDNNKSSLVWLVVQCRTGDTTLLWKCFFYLNWAVNHFSNVDNTAKCFTSIRHIWNLHILGAVSIRKTVLPGMAIPMLKIRRPNGRLIFNMEITIRR